MSRKIYYQKLVRDNIPEIIKQSGNACEVRILDDQEFEKELKKKLVEEGREVAGATDEGLTNELADVLELIKSIATYHNIPFSQIEKFQKEKRIKRGAFKKKIFLEWSTEQDK